MTALKTRNISSFANVPVKIYIMYMTNIDNIYGNNKKRKTPEINLTIHQWEFFRNLKIVVLHTMNLFFVGIPRFVTAKISVFL